MEEKRFIGGPGILTPGGETNPCEGNSQTVIQKESKPKQAEHSSERNNLQVTNAKANAGNRARWNIWNLYLNLCWLEMVEHFKPALALASTVTINFMTQKIGKYKVYENETNFKIRYLYTFSDIIGSIWFLLSFLLGLLLLFVSFRTFSFDKTTSWLILLVAIGLTIFGIYMIIAGLYNPTKGILQFD